MKSHFCSKEGTTVEFEGECNWCGAKEVVPPKLTDANISLYKLAEEAGFDVAQWAINGGKEVIVYYEGPITGELERFAALVAAHEREKQAEQEPIAWFVQYKNRHEFVFGSKPELVVDGVVEPLYAAPVRTKDLTDDEIHKLVKQVRFDGMTDRTFQFARAVIAADREKNK